MNKVYAASHPLRAQRDCYEVPEGSTVKEIVDLVDDNSGLRKHFVVHVGGRVVPQQYWQYVTPKANTNIAIRAVPMGGGDDKDPLRTILLVVVAVAAAWVTGGGAAAGGWFTAGSTSAAVAGAAVSIVGRLIVDAIAPPPTPDELGGGGVDRDQRRPSIENARNRPARYQPIPRVYGTVRFVPPYSVLPYTEIRGNDQYLHFAVCWGYGPLDIGQIKIGDTIIEEYENPKGGVGDKWLEISHDSGDGNWSNGQLISNDVSEQNLNVLLENSNGFTTRTTDVNTDEISVDITFPQGLVEFKDNGDKKSRTVITQIEYSPAGQNAWQSAISTEGTVGPFTLTVPSYSYPARMGPTPVTKELIYSIYLNLSDNTIGSTTGSLTMYTVTGRGGSIILQSNATIPPVPAGTVKLATVTTSKTGVTDNGITSINNTARPTDEFGSNSDFIVSKDTSNSVSISSGSVIAYSDGFPTTASSTSAVRNTYKFKVPNGQYDVRLKRNTADSTDDRIRDQLVWSAFRSIKHTEPVDTGFANSVNLAQTQIIIKATDQLNGVVDQLNGVVSSIIPDYNSSNDTWEEVTTSNPASIYRDILQGNANKEPIPDSRIDLSTMEYFHGRSDAKDFYYNDVIQGGSVQDALKQVLSIARASHTMIDGVHSLVIDEEKTDVVQHFTPRNSKNFSGTKRFSKQPHAIKVPFNNRELGYTQDEAIAYDDGYSADGTNCTFLDENGQCNVATEFESVDIKGITDGEQAWRYGRYLLATNKLRPENYTLDVDLEHLVATRGDLVRITHDVPMFGLASGRVKSIETSGTNTTGVTLDQELELAANTDYTIRFRLANGDTLTRDIAQVGTDTTTKSVTFTTAIATSNGPQIGDLAMFGLQNEETVDCIIKEIQSSGADWGATLTLVDHAQPAIDDSADSSIPEFNSNISENPFTRQRPPVPEVEGIRSDESALRREDDGTISTNIMVSFKEPSSSEVEATHVEIRWVKVGEDQSWEYNTVPTSQTNIFVPGVNQGETYRIDIRSLSENGLASDWTEATSSHTVVGKVAPPQQVNNFEVNPARDRIEFEWDENPELDVAKYEIREGASWGSGTVVGKTDSTKLQTRNVSNGPWWIKAIDSLKNYSTTATQGTISVSLPTVNSVRAQVIDNVALLRWQSSIGTFDLATHEIRRGANFSTAEVVGDSDKTFDQISELEGGTYTYWVAAVDAAGNIGPEESITVSVDDPPDFELRDQFQTDWQGYTTTALTPVERTSTIFRRSVRDFTGVELDGVDDNVALDDFYDSTQSTLTFEAWFQTFEDGIIASWDRSEFFRVEVGGDAADSGHVGASFVSGGSVQDSFGGTSFVADGRWHHVAFVYDANSFARLYVDGTEENTFDPTGSDLGSTTTRYGFLGVGSEADTFDGTTGPGTNFDGRLSEIRRWTTARTATEIQDNKDRTLDGTETGLASYWRIQADSSSEEPPTITDKSTNSHDGQLNGGSRYTSQIRSLAPHDDLSRDELGALGYNSRDEMINAGYDYRAQPTPSSAQFVEIYDSGAVIPSTSVQVLLNKTDIVGSVSPTITISVRENAGDPWNDFPAGQSQIFATQFRWVKVTVDFSVSSDTDFAVLDDIRTTLKTKLKDDSGTVPVTANPTTVNFNVDYIDVTSVTATPQGTTALLAVVDFGDTPNPSGFDVYLFDSAGNAATGDVRWNARGI